MSLLYLDSSALVELIAREPETPALLSLLELRPEVVSSALARVEVLRAVSRAGRAPGSLERARDVLSRVALIAMDGGILDAAATIQPAELRSLDAIHLATALSLHPEAAMFVSYDERLNAAAAAARLRVVSPR